MKINELTIGEVKELTKMFNSCFALDLEHPYIIGEKYLFRLVTHYYTGKLVEVYNQEIVIEDAAWIADTGRFHDALKNGTLKEVEPFLVGKIVIGRGALIDASIWNHDLPKKQK